MYGTDSRRNLGPSGAQPLKFASQSILDEKIAKTTSKGEVQQIATSKPKRFIRTGDEEGTNGSSYLETEGTIINCSLYGPRPILSRQYGFKTHGELNINFKFTPFADTSNLQDTNSSTTKTGASSVKSADEAKTSSVIFTNQELESRLSSFITTCFTSVIQLQKYPKSSIEIFIKIISLNQQHSLTYLVSLIVDAVSLLLVDSGIEISDMVTAGYKIDNSSPDSLIEMVAGVIGTSLGPENESIVGIWCDSKKCGDDKMIEMIDHCIEDSKILKKEYNSYFLNLVQ